MQNMSIFEFVGLETDPVYQQMSTLQQGEEIIIEGLYVRVGERFYEVESEQEHLPFNDLFSCYQYVNHVLVAQVNYE